MNKDFKNIMKLGKYGKEYKDIFEFFSTVLSSGDYFDRFEYEFGKSGNSFNWNSELVFSWHEVEVFCGYKFTQINFHLGGDPRGNYYDKEFLFAGGPDQLFMMLCDIGLSRIKHKNEICGYKMSYETDIFEDEYECFCVKFVDKKLDKAFREKFKEDIESGSSVHSDELTDFVEEYAKENK